MFSFNVSVEVKKIFVEQLVLHICRKKNFQLAFTSSKLTIETLEQGVKYVQS